MSLLGTALGAVGGVASGIINNIWNRSNMKKQFEYNTQLNQQQNDFNEYMWNQNNAYNDPSAQRDRLVDAGLNPINVGEMNGNTATAASASSGGSVGLPQSTIDMGNPALVAAQIENIKANTNKQNAEANYTDVQKAVLEGCKDGMIRYQNIQCDLGESQISLNNKQIEQIGTAIEKMDNEIAALKTSLINMNLEQDQIIAQTKHLQNLDEQGWKSLALQAGINKATVDHWTREDSINAKNAATAFYKAVTERRSVEGQLQVNGATIAYTIQGTKLLAQQTGAAKINNQILDLSLNTGRFGYSQMVKYSDTDKAFEYMTAGASIVRDIVGAGAQIAGSKKGGMTINNNISQ